MRSRSIIVLCIAVLGFAGAAFGQACDVTANNGPTHYSSVNAALLALPDRDSNRLDVNGICQEQVMVLNHVNLTIEGHGGARIEAPPSVTQSQPQTLNIRVSDGVNVRNLTIRGKTNVAGAVSVMTSRNVTFDNSVIENGGSEGGVWIVNSFQVFLQNSTIQNNGNGIRVDGPASATLIGNWGPNPPGTAYLQNNKTGVTLNPGAFFSLRGDSVVHNNNVGVSGVGGNFMVCCFQDSAHPRIEDNAFYGVLMRGGDVQIQSQLIVQRNGDYGFALVGTQARLWDCFIRDNGTSEGGLGILAIGGLVDVQRTEISGNSTGGAIVADGGTLRLTDGQVTGNGGLGVDVQSVSVVNVFGTAIKDNRGFDLRCAPSSSGHGTEETIGKMQCPGFGHEPDPIPGPKD
jgi:hypothetical protein